MGRASGRNSCEIYEELSAAAGDGRNDQNFVSFFKAVLFIAEEADVFFVYIEVNEAANLSVFASQVLAKRRETAFNIRNKLGEICGGTGDFSYVVGVLLECVR